MPQMGPLMWIFFFMMALVLIFSFIIIYYEVGYVSLKDDEMKDKEFLEWWW